MWTLNWFGFIQCDKYTEKVFNVPVKWQSLQQECIKDVPNFPNWKKDSSVYFRHLPYIKDVIMLIVLSILHTINFIFKDNIEINKMET